jgi:hypothetical protein
MTLFIAIDTVAINGEVSHALFLTVLLSTSTTSVVDPFAVLCEVQAAFIVAMPVPLAFRTPSGFLIHLANTYLLACNVQTIPDSVIGGLSGVEEQLQMCYTLHRVPSFRWFGPLCPY